MSQKTGKKLRFKHLAAAVCILLAAISCIFSVDFDVDAAGSKNLTATQDPSTGTWNTNSGYRPYLEWNDATTAGVVRRQIIKVYVNAGETLYFGSSVSNGIGGDIVVRKPDGSLVPAASLDVKSDTLGLEGYINTRAKELAGPYYPGSGKTDGYTPLSLLVDQAGIWEFEFHTLDTPTTNTDPPPDLLTASTVQLDAAGGLGVSAWDITVVATDAVGVPTEITGRVFANFLTLCTGNTFNGQNVMESTVYVLTKDGYVYTTDFNGMDPFGFIFFANNRGLINTDTNTSLYRSGVGLENSMNPIYSGSATASFQPPNAADTTLDSTYKVFFEVPAADLPTSIKPVPYAPGTITNFRFVGDVTAHGYVGSGGEFIFDAAAVSSFQIKLDFTGYDNSGGTNIGGIVYLSNACVDGENRITWDGRDGNGTIVPAGNYGGADSGVVITIVAKAGEYHFPMFDVENNKNGTTIKMISDPLDSNNQLMPITEGQRTIVYYDNSEVGKIVAEYQALGQTALLDMLAGMDSTAGASPFGTRDPYRQGDFSAIDIWTYYIGDLAQAPIYPVPFTLEDLPDISGFVFYNVIKKDGNYKITAGDFPLSGVTVNLSYNDSDGNYQVVSTETDSEGMYYFSNIINDTYCLLEVELPYESASVTYGDDFQWIYNDNNVNTTVSAENVGIDYQRTAQNITVNKVWAVDSNLDILQPESVTIRVVGTYNSTVISKSITLSSANNWQHTFNDLPRSVYVNGRWRTLVYTVTEDPVPGYTPTITTPVNTSTNLTKVFTNTPLGRITLTKEDADTSEKLGGAVFDLYKRAASGVGMFITTRSTDADGIIFIQDLAEGTYYFIETTAPSGYTLDPAHLMTADIIVGYTADTFNKSITITNEKKCNFTLTKTITQAAIADEQFLFEITGPAGIYYAVITIAADDTTASQAFIGMPAGTYSVVEKNSNWRYTLETDTAQTNYTRATNGTDTFAYADNKLSMPIQDSLNTNYLFTFVDKKSIEQWVSGHSSVTNTMVIPDP